MDKVDYRYMYAIASVLGNTDATQRNWYGKREKIPTGVPYRFVGEPVHGPQCVTCTLQVRDEDLQKLMSLDERFAMAAGSSFARTYRDLSVIRVEFTLPRGEWRTIYLNDLPHRPNAATIGLKALGPLARVGWDPPHKAVFGRTQSGKTTCLADFLLSLARHQPEDYQFVIINPKNDPALRFFARLPHLAVPVGSNYEDSIYLLRWTLAEMHRRKDDDSHQSGRLVVFVDEVAQLVEIHPEAGAIITQLSQMAAGLHINLVVASQASNPSVFGEKGSLARANFSSRLVFQLTADQSYLATGLAGQHTERLGGQGDGLAINGDRVTRFRAALPRESDYERLPLTDSEPDWPDSDQVAGDRAIEWQTPPKMVHYALHERGSASALQREFGGAMARAQLVRNWAIEYKKIHRVWKARKQK